MDNRDYIYVLIQGLEKKVRVLNLILTENHKQRQLLNDPELDPDDLEKNLDEKAEYIEQLRVLDDGFEQVFARVKEELDSNRQAYAKDILRMQELITQITEKSNQIKTEELRNRDLMVQKFSEVKKQIREVKSSQKAVNQYYQSMMKLNYVDPQFMDDKQ